MNRFVAVLQIVVALILLIAALSVLVNAIMLATRPETISVVNSFIGLGVMLVAMTALGTILMRKGIARLREGDGSGDSGSPAGSNDG